MAANKETWGALVKGGTKAHPEFSSKESTLKLSCKAINVFYLLQSMAANRETRGTLVKALTPHCLTTLIVTNFLEIDHYETVGMVSLSVVGRIYQNLEGETGRWAIDNDVILICQHAMRAGSSYSKLMALVMLESILKSEKGVIIVSNRDYTHLKSVIGSFANLVAAPRTFSPVHSSLIVGFRLLLTRDQRACELLLLLPSRLTSSTGFSCRITSIGPSSKLGYGHSQLLFLVLLFFTSPTLAHRPVPLRNSLLPSCTVLHAPSSAARDVFLIPRWLGHIIVYGGIGFSCVLFAIAFCWCIAHKVQNRRRPDDLDKDVAPSCATTRARKRSKYQNVIDRIDRIDRGDPIANTLHN